MASSSPSRPPAHHSNGASVTCSSPERHVTPLSDFLTPERNSEANHREALAAAAAEHTRIRERANHTLLVYEQEQRQKAILELQQQELERLRGEERLRAETEKLRALRAKSIPQPPPEPELPSPPPQQRPPSRARESASTAQDARSQPAAAAVTTPPSSTTPRANPFAAAKAAQPGFLSTTPSSQPPYLTHGHTSSPSRLTSVLTNGIPVKPASAPIVSNEPPNPSKERYIAMHKALKDIRINIAEQGRNNTALKSMAGDMRREVRKCVGQLSLDKDGNRRVMVKITALLKSALANTVDSAMLDPALIVHQPRQPVEGAANNAELPSLFLYVLNIFAKSIIKQFINECSANTKLADTIGVTASSTFSDPAFLWRGQSLIDVLITKFQMSCPVLFGAKGNQKTEQGRQRLGWKRSNGAWVSESEHLDRMMGLGAGYAAISLRDFSKSKKTNPWPMTHYWSAMATIVDTPPEDVSDTQCVVLKAIIEHYEKRFILFYGNAAIAALRLALLQFPQSLPQQSTASRTLTVHGELLKKTWGLNAD